MNTEENISYFLCAELWEANGSAVTAGRSHLMTILTLAISYNAETMTLKRDSHFRHPINCWISQTNNDEV